MSENLENNSKNNFDRPDELTDQIAEDIVQNVSWLQPGYYIEFGCGERPYPSLDSTRRFSEGSQSYYVGIDGGRSRYGESLDSLDPRIIGCGAIGLSATGEWVMLNRSFARRNPSALKFYSKVRQSLILRNPNASIILGDIKQTPLKPGVAREVFANDVMLSPGMIMEDMASVTASARRVLGPDGIFVVKESEHGTMDPAVLIEELRRAGFAEVFYLPRLLRQTTEQPDRIRSTMNVVYGTNLRSGDRSAIFIARGQADESVIDALSKLPRRTAIQRLKAVRAQATVFDEQ